MTLDEAVNAIGRTVIYRSYGSGRVEFGVITEVRSRWVFVRYGEDENSKATMPQDLVLLIGQVIR